jgi:hypothetical protein
MGLITYRIKQQLFDTFFLYSIFHVLLNIINVLISYFSLSTSYSFCKIQVQLETRFLSQFYRQFLDKTFIF